MSFAYNMQILFTLLKVFVPIILVFFVMFVFLKFRYFLIIRHRGPEGYVQWTEFGLARKKEDKETRSPRLQRLFKKTDYVPLPSANAIVPTKGGRFIVEFAKNPDGSYQAIQAPGLDSSESERKSVFDPISRAEYVIHEKLRLNQLSNWKQLIFPMTCLFIMAILIVSGMIFYGEVAQPLIQQANINGEVSRIQGETAVKMDAMVEQTNRLLVNMQKMQQGEEGIYPPQVITEDGP